MCPSIVEDVAGKMMLNLSNDEKRHQLAKVYILNRTFKNINKKKFDRVFACSKQYCSRGDPNKKSGPS